MPLFSRDVIFCYVSGQISWNLFAARRVMRPLRTIRANREAQEVTALE